MEVPFVLERVVIADRGAASESGHSPPFSPPFEILKTSKYWWEPIRRTLTTYLDLPENSGSKKQVVTYLSSQEGGGLKLKKTDHEALVKELNKMGRGYGFEILVVSGKATWEHRMTAIARSTVKYSSSHIVSASTNNVRMTNRPSWVSMAIILLMSSFQNLPHKQQLWNFFLMELLCEITNC